MAEAIQSLKEDSDAKGLLALKSQLRGPVQLMQVNCALAEVWEEDEMWEEAAEAWRECLVLSPANPELWERLGDVALKAKRVPLALSAFQTAYDLGRNLSVLLKVARVRFDLHDYANALTLCAFMSAAGLEEADSLRARIQAVLQGEVLHVGHFIRAKELLLSDFTEKLVIKVANMTGLAKAIRRQQELSKEDSIHIFQRVPVKDSFETPQSGPRAQGKKQKGPLALLQNLAEDLKKEILAISEPTVPPLFGLNPLPPLPNFKSKCSAEPCLDQFLDTEWRLAPLVRTIITTLCSNRPHPSPALSDELGWEVLHLYLVADPPLELEDEVLTLLELALRDTEHVSTLQKLQQTVLEQASSFSTPELQLRLKYALAWCYYHVGEDKSKEDQADALISAYALLEEVESLVGDATHYFWWYGKVLNKASLQVLKDSVRDEMLLTKAGEALKGNPKGSATLLGILSSLCSLLKKRCAKDDPAFYWRKMKIVLKNLSKCALDASERLQFSQCLSTFLGVLQYNLEDGSKLSRDVDLRLILKTVARTLFPKGAERRLAHEAYAAVAAVNIVKARTELFVELPFIVKSVLLSAESMTQYFLRFHLLCFEFAGTEKDFHFTLCRAFEKPAALSGNREAMNIIYSQLYGFSVLHKECPCKWPKLAPPDVSFPKSLGKLRRMVDYVYQNSLHMEVFGIYFPQTLDKEFSPALERCILRLPGLHLDCPHLKQPSAIATGLVANRGQCDFNHLACCSATARPVAERFLKRYAADCYEQALKKEAHASFLSLLDTAEGWIEKLLVLNTKSETAWLLLGQLYLHKWMAGYFDNALVGIEKPEYGKYAELSVHCFAVLDTLNPRAIAHTQLVRGLLAFLQYRLTGQGLLDAQRHLRVALQSPQESENLEALMIAALLELHMRTPQAETLFEQIESESRGQYAYLRKIARVKAAPSEEAWRDLEQCPQSDLYLNYVLGKRLREEYRDHLVNTNNCFFLSQKIFETKVMDRCIVFQRKRARVAARYVEHFSANKDLMSLFQLTRELGLQKGAIFERVWADAVQRLAALFPEVSDVSELKQFYEFQDLVSSSETLSAETKSALGAQLTDTLAKFHDVFGAERCEALRPTKRRRKRGA